MENNRVENTVSKELQVASPPIGNITNLMMLTKKNLQAKDLVIAKAANGETIDPQTASYLAMSENGKIDTKDMMKMQLAQSNPNMAMMAMMGESVSMKEILQMQMFQQMQAQGNGQMNPMAMAMVMALDGDSGLEMKDIMMMMFAQTMMANMQK